LKGESGTLTLFVGGMAKEIAPGERVDFGVGGLTGPGTEEKEPSAPKPAPTSVETFHYLTGREGTGEIALPGDSRINLGVQGDLMLSANRSEVGPFYVGEMRAGAFHVKVMEETGIVMETATNRLAFLETAAAPAKEKPAEKEKPAPPAEGEAKPSEGDKGAGQEESGNVIWVHVKGEVEIFRHSLGAPLAISSKRLEGFRVEIPVGGGADVIHPENLAGQVVVHAFESEEGAKPIKIVIGDKVFILPPKAKAKVEPRPRAHPEDTGKVLLGGGALEIMLYTFGGPLAYRFRLTEGGLVAPRGAAFESPGDVKVTREASPYLP
ncbi:MAG: hypothetical protein ACYTHM_04335, partial [Planctomycetota bacterium]